MSILLKERIYEVYQAFSAGRLDLLAEMFDEQVDFMSNAPIEVFPYLGRLLGRAALIKAFQTIYDEFESIAFVPLRIIVDGDSAGIIVSVRTQTTAR